MQAREAPPLQVIEPLKITISVGEHIELGYDKQKRSYYSQPSRK